MPFSSSKPAWSRIAALPEADLKEAILTGFKQGKPFAPHDFHLIELPEKIGNILDFGCGIGRNFTALRDKCHRLFAYDIPEMLTACKRYSNCHGVEPLWTWGELLQNRYDLAVAILVLQHFDNEQMIEYKLQRLSRQATYLYVGSRSWCDTNNRCNLFNLIEATGSWQLLQSSRDVEELRSLQYPDEQHFDAVFKTTDAEQLQWSSTRSSIVLASDVEYEPTDWRANITMAQLFTPNYESFAWDVLQNKRSYAERHGYRFAYRCEPYEHAKNRHPSWHRIPMIQELFRDKTVGWVFWTDIDAVIMRPSIRLESHLVKYMNYDLVVVNQGLGEMLGKSIPDCICFGHFFIRNTHWSKEFLQLVWDFPSTSGYPDYLTEPCWEQEAVNALIHDNALDCRDHVAIVANRQFNSFEHKDYRPGDFMVHFAGVRDVDEVGRRVRKYLKRIPDNEKELFDAR